jgi:hypothetical protein
MNKGLPTSNRHFTQTRRDEIDPNLSRITPLESHTGTMERHYEAYLDRYSPPWSSKLNIFDNARTVEPQNVFGRKYIPYRDDYVHLTPAGMFNQTQPKPLSYSMTTKPFVKKFNTV